MFINSRTDKVWYPYSGILTAMGMNKLYNFTPKCERISQTLRVYTLLFT